MRDVIATSTSSGGTTPDAQGGRVLVAGVGNIFLSDDGFGSEVARRLLAQPTTGGQRVQVVDYGIRGVHLAYDLLEGYDALILVDTVPPSFAAETPGTITVLEVSAADLDGRTPGEARAAPVDSHAMDPLAVLRSVQTLGGDLPQTYVVGCVPESVDEGMGLSDAVTAAIPNAIAAVDALVAEHVSARGRY